MSQTALYRKYRSQTFDEVIGQPHIVTALKNAVSADRYSHAYLFTGPRGVGKTTVARLLARSANCTGKTTGSKPCNNCPNCQVAIGSHLDLIEIDAASHRGIDDARDLREKITSAPSMGRYKVYIIDEVHMLTTEAFNALLKTIEEPPAHAIFILATTEAHKLPETIISRTQRFVFKQISDEAIVGQLQSIAAQEKISAKPEALTLIAKTSDGSFRDAISLLDQLATSHTVIEIATVRQILGQSDPEIVEAISQAITSAAPVKALEAVDKASAQGVQPAQLANQIIVDWRQRLRRNLAEASDAAQTVAVIEELLPVLRSPWPELALEAALVKLASVSSASSVLKEAPVRPVAPEPEKQPEPQAQGSGDDQELWIKALGHVKQRNNSLYALLRSSCNVKFDGDTVILECRFSFHRDRLKEPKNLQVIEQSLVQVFGRKFRVLPELAASPVAPVDTTSELMSSALEILGGEVVHE